MQVLPGMFKRNVPLSCGIFAADFFAQVSVFSVGQTRLSQQDERIHDVLAKPDTDTECRASEGAPVGAREERCFSKSLKSKLLFRRDTGGIKPNPKQDLGNIWFSLCVAFLPLVVPRAVCNAFLSQQDSKDESSAKRC